MCCEAQHGRNEVKKTEAQHKDSESKQAMSKKKVVPDAGASVPAQEQPAWHPALAYTMDDDGRLCLESRPAGFLPSAPSDELKLRIWYDGSTDSTEHILSWHEAAGDCTMDAFTVPVPPLADGARDIRLNAEILMDGAPLYNSRTALHRKIVFVHKRTEALVGRLELGDYTIFAPATVTLYIDTREQIARTLPPGTGLQAWFVELDPPAFVGTKEQVFFAGSAWQNFETYLPEETQTLPRLQVNGENYLLAYRTSSLAIMSAPEFWGQHRLFIDGELVEWNKVANEDNPNRFEIAFPKDAESVCIELRSRQTWEPVWNERFLFIPEPASCQFNRPYYYEPQDSEGACCDIQLGDFREHLVVPEGAEELQVSYGDGELHIPVPRVTIEEEGRPWLKGEEHIAYAPEVAKSSTILISHPPNVSVEIYIDGKEDPLPGERAVRIGKELNSLEHKSAEGVRNVTARLTSKDAGRSNQSKDQTDEENSNAPEGAARTYLLGKVALKACFTEPLQIWSEGSSLRWNGRNKFVGPRGQEEMEIVLTNAETGRQKHALPIGTDEGYTHLPPTVQPGEYNFKVSLICRKKGKGAKKTAPTMMGIVKGTCTIGPRDA